MNEAPAKRRHTSLKVWAIFFGAIGLLFVFNCSGLRFPIRNAKAKLEGHLANDLNFGPRLPASAKVTHAARVAYMDPSEFYVVEMNQTDVPAFIEAVRKGGKSPSEGRIDNNNMGRTPKWFTPTSLPQAQRLDLFSRDDGGGFSLFYSPASPTVYVFWYRT